MKRTLIAGIAAVTLAVAASSSLAAVATPEVRTLPNGMRAAFVPRPGLPLVQVTLALPAGTATEAPDEAGAALITRDLIMFGTSSRSGPAFAAAVERLGSISTSLTREHVLISGTFRAQDLRSGIELMADVVLRPVLAAPDVEMLERRHGAAVDAQGPEALADATAWSAAFPEHPYGRPSAPAGAVLRGLGVDKVRAFFARGYAPRGAMILVSGDTTAEQAFAAVTEWFGGWERGGDTTSVPAPAAAARGRVLVLDRPNVPRAEVRLVFRAPGRGDDDEAAFAVAAALLATGANSPLARICPAAPRRIESTLAGGGILAVGGAVPADSARAVAEALAAAARGVATASPEAVARARMAARHALMAQIETLPGFGAAWTEGVLEGAAPGFLAALAARIDAVTPEDVAAVAARRLDPARASYVFVGPQAAMGELASLGNLAVVAPGAGAAEEVESATPQQLARGKALVRKAISAHGGLARLRAMRESIIEADAVLHVRGSEVHGRIRQVRKDPYRMIYTTSFNGLDTRQVLNGDRAWAVEPHEGETRIRDLDEVGTAGMRSGFDGDLVRILLTAQSDSVEAVALGKGRIGDRDVESVEIRSAGSRWILHFETRTGRLAAWDQPDGGPEDRLPRRVYGDYRKVEGVLWPHSEERLLGKDPLMRLTVTQVASSATVDDIEFEKPAALEVAPPR